MTCDLCASERESRLRAERERDEARAAEDEVRRGLTVARDDRDYFKASYARKLDDERRALEAVSAAYAETVRGEIEPHLRTEGEIRELQPRVESMSERLCQTQGMILWALKESGLTVVRLDPSAREIAPTRQPKVDAALSSPAVTAEGKKLGEEGGGR